LLQILREKCAELPFRSRSTAISMHPREKRPWKRVEAAIVAADEARVYDNSSARKPFRTVARYERGRQVGAADFPPWSPIGK